MPTKQLLVEQALGAIAAFRSKSLSLGGLVSRLESLRDALADEGIGLGESVSREILQLEIINSLIASGDQAGPSSNDLADIELYLQHIGDQFRSVPFDNDE